MLGGAMNYQAIEPAHRRFAALRIDRQRDQVHVRGLRSYRRRADGDEHEHARADEKFHAGPDRTDRVRFSRPKRQTGVIHRTPTRGTMENSIRAMVPPEIASLSPSVRPAR